jgi:hypothetical protein
VENVVLAKRGVEQITRSDAGWVMVVVFGARSRNLNQI